MQVSFRNGFYAGLLAALITGLYLVRLWQPELQIELHNRHLLAAIEQRDWSAVGNFIGADYQDRWGNDRPLLLERLTQVFRALPQARIQTADASVRADDGRGYCTARITLTAGGDYAARIEARVNSLPTPFEFEWRRRSAKPWDWKLVRVENPALEISGDL